MSSISIKQSFGFVFVFMLGMSVFSSQTRAGDLSWDEWSQVKEKGSPVLQMTIENDSLLFQGYDRFYTSGNHLSQTYVLATPVRSVSYGWNFGQDLYTASDVKLAPANIPKSDHPYAGWLSAGIYREVAEVNGHGSRLGIDLGCLGPCAGGLWTQTNLHRVLQQPLPKGWSSQFHNEVGVVLSGELTPVRWMPSASLDVTPRIKGRFGNIFIDAGADMVIRYGALNALPQQLASYAFLRSELKLVGYNASLQGGYFNHQDSGVTPRRSVGELELGYVWRTASYGLNASIVRRSNEVEGLSNSVGAQNFARLQFLYAM